MAINSRHPQYDRREPLWRQMEDTYEGEHRVKEMGTKYLPPTTGMQIDGMQEGQPGLESYQAYKARAVFNNYVRRGITQMVGMLHQEPARIEVPAAMQPVIERMTFDGESAQSLLRKMNEYQLLYGRCGALVEVPTGLDDTPFVALYAAPDIINWDAGNRPDGRQELEYVVLDESGQERDESFEFTHVERYRVAAMSPIAAALTGTEDAGSPEYRVAVTESDSTAVSEEEFITPSFRGRTLDHIPFVFVNTKDLVSDVDDVPLIDLSTVSLALYRGEADMRQLLHMQGQDTLVVSGSETEGDTRLGAGAKIEVPMGGDAKFISISPNGISHMLQVIRRDKEEAGEIATRLLETAGTTYQSGEALRVRIAARTATLRSVAETSAEAMRQLLRIIARWMGENPDEVVVEPNTEFTDQGQATRTVMELAQAKQMGFPLSNQSLHRFAQRSDLTELTFEQEQQAIDAEPVRVEGSEEPGALGGLDGFFGEPAEDDGDGE